MSKIASAFLAAIFVLGLTPALAQVKQKEQVHKGTAEQGTLQKKAQKKDQTKVTKKKAVDKQ